MAATSAYNVLRQEPPDEIAASELLKQSFTWSETTEGPVFWNEWYQKLHACEDAAPKSGDAA